MERRGFLRALGIGGALAVAAPQIVLAATTKVATPERRVFLPPDRGWLPWIPWQETEAALAYARPIPGTNDLYLDYAGRWSSEEVWGQRSGLLRWTLDIERSFAPICEPSFDGPTQIGGAEGWLESWDINYFTGARHERYSGFGVPPKLAELGQVRANIRVEYPALHPWLKR